MIGFVIIELTEKFAPRKLEKSSMLLIIAVWPVMIAIAFVTTVAGLLKK